MSGSNSRLRLRRPASDDADILFAIYGDPRTNQTNPAGPFPDLEKAEAVLASWMAHWAEHGFGVWAIVRAEAPDQVIGFGGLSLRLYGEVEKLNLGYRFAVEAWGQGYATELGRAALDHAFKALRRDEVFGLVRPANTASIHVLEKLGMTRVGELDDVPGEAKSFVYAIRNPAAAPA